MGFMQEHFCVLILNLSQISLWGLLLQMLRMGFTKTVALFLNENTPDVIVKW